jgi:hypothetical protein
MEAGLVTDYVQAHEPQIDLGRKDKIRSAAASSTSLARLADALGVTIVTSDQVFDAAGNCISPRIEIQLKILSQQVVHFARLSARADRCQRIDGRDPRSHAAHPRTLRLCSLAERRA